MVLLLMVVRQLLNPPTLKDAIDDFTYKPKVVLRSHIMEIKYGLVRSLTI